MGAIDDVIGYADMEGMADEDVALARAELRQKDDALKAAREYLDNLRRRGGFNESRDAVIRLIDKALG